MRARSLGAIEAAVAAGLAIGVGKAGTAAPELRRLGPADGLPALPAAEISLHRARGGCRRRLRPARRFPGAGLRCEPRPGSRMTMTDARLRACREAVLAYADACRARMPGFAARHFGRRGSLRLHREAVGLDLLLRAVQRAAGRPGPFRAAGGAGSAGGWAWRRHRHLAGAAQPVRGDAAWPGGWPIWW